MVAIDQFSSVQQIQAPQICIQCGQQLQPQIHQLRRARLELLTQACAAFAEFTLLQNEFHTLTDDAARRQNLLHSQDQLDIVARYLFDSYSRAVNG